MGLSRKYREKKTLAITKHTEMDVKKYTSAIFFKHKESIERFFFSYGMMPSEKEMEDVCKIFMHDVFRSIGHCIRHNVEVRIIGHKNKYNEYFSIKYNGRNQKDLKWWKEYQSRRKTGK